MGWRTAEYKENYPDEMIRIFKKEGGIADFCVFAQIGRRKFYDWLNWYPELAKAYDYACEIQEVWLTALGKAGIRNKEFNAVVWSMFMRNKCDFTEHRKVAIDFTGCKTPDERMAIIDQFVKDRKLTSKEAKDYTDYVANAALIHERTTVAQDVEELKEIVKK